MSEVKKKVHDKTRKIKGIKKDHKKTEIEKKISRTIGLTAKHAAKTVETADTEEKKIIQENQYYWSVVNQYYSLKGQYKNELQDLEPGEKAKCVNCKRYVGSTFLNPVRGKKQDIDGRIFSLTCGDKKNPCPLNIHFFIPDIQTYLDLMNNDKNKIDDWKFQIILIKNDIIFDYTQQAQIEDDLERFMDLINDRVKTFEYTFELYANIMDNNDEKALTTQLTSDITEAIQRYKLLLYEFKQTRNSDFSKEAVNVYRDEILPKTTQLRNLKYSYNGVVLNEKTDEYSLNQTIKTIEYKEAVDRVPLLTENLKRFIIQFTTGLKGFVDLDAKPNEKLAKEPKGKKVEKIEKTKRPKEQRRRAEEQEIIRPPIILNRKIRLIPATEAMD